MFPKLLCSLAALVACVQAGSFVVLHSPENLVFQGKDKLEQSSLKDIYSAALGYTAKPSDWNGMSYDNPFNLPKAVVAVVVEGVDTLGKIQGKKKLLLNDDRDEEFTWQTLSGRLQSRDHDNKFVRISLADGIDALGQSALGELKPNSTDDLRAKAPSLKNIESDTYLEEIQLLNAIADEVRTAPPKHKPTVFWFVISGLKPIIDAHGNNSVAAKEALNLLDKTLQVVSKSFKHVYNNKVLITAFTNTAILDRRSRNAKEEAGTPQDEETLNKENLGVTNKEREEEYTEEKIPEINSREHEKIQSKHKNDNNEEATHNYTKEYTDITAQTESILSTTEDFNFYNYTYYSNDSSEANFENLAPIYKEDYPVVFNIVLWFMVVFFFSLLAICIVIAEMDPGRDSIIYRMTSNRMKKDN